jgi:hypothetical protein
MIRRPDLHVNILSVVVNCNSTWRYQVTRHNMYKASVSPGLVQQIMTYFW